MPEVSRPHFLLRQLSPETTCFSLLFSFFFSLFLFSWEGGVRDGGVKTIAWNSYGGFFKKVRRFVFNQ